MRILLIPYRLALATNRSFQQKDKGFCLITKGILCGFYPGVECSRFVQLFIGWDSLGHDCSYRFIIGAPAACGNLDPNAKN